MKRTGKWILGARADQPVTAAARRAVERRLAGVAHYLPLAARKAEQDLEYVHQLRVATRRAHAALKIFSDLLPAKRYRRMNKRLKQIRRAAGDARDLDVLLVRLEKLAGQHPQPGGPALLDELRAQRAAAQPAIKSVSRAAKAWGFKRQARELARRVRARTTGKPPTFLDAARSALTPLAERLLAILAGPLDDLPKLHEARIRGKQLRYAMEIFAGAFRAGFREELYAPIEQLQELLGEINDRATTIDRCAARLAETDDDERRSLVRNLLTTETEALTQARHDFGDWWTRERREALAARFAAYLGSPPAASADRTAAAS